MTTTILEEGRFHWGIAIAGAVAATATTFLLLTLGAGVGLALAPTHPTAGKEVAFITLGAVYFFAAQAFGFAVGGYLVGRMIGPESGENRKEEEFRAAAHGFVMWAVAVVSGLLILAASSGGAGSVMSTAASQNASDSSDYFVDLMFRGAPASAQLDADKAEATRILPMAATGATSATSASDTTRLGRMVSQDVNLSESAGLERVADVEARARLAADQARKAASILSLWTALSLLFGSAVAIASAISARWMDDRISFSMARRN